MSNTHLNNEITTDPLGLGYAPFVAAGNDQGVADLLNAKAVSSSRKVPLWEIKRQALQHGYWVAIRAAATSHPNQQVQAAAISAVDFVDDFRFTTMDLSDSAVQLMLAALVSGGVMTSDQKAALDGLAVTMISRAEQLFGEGTAITNTDVSFALRGQK